MPELTHGSPRAQCPACRLYFKSESAFDKHRTGSHQKQTRRCLTEPEMTARGMAPNDAGFWRVPKPPSALTATEAA